MQDNERQKQRVRSIAGKLSTTRETARSQEADLREALAKYLSEYGSQSAAAREFGVTKAYVSDIVRARRGISDEMVSRLIEL